MVSYHPLIVPRPPLLSLAQLERIEEAVQRLLEEVGIAVLEEEVLESLRTSGFSVRDGRVFIERKLVSEFLEAERKRHGDQFAGGPQPVPNSGEFGYSSQIELSVSPYPQHVHDLETDQIVPFTTERLIEATKLVDALSLPGPPGCPVDVPPPLQPVVQYWVAATCCRQGRHPVDPKSLATLPYVMDMAEVLEHPLRSLPIYVFSPLTLGGESLRCALKFKDRLSAVGVSDMNSVGCTVPINVGDAAALSVAEVVGSVILLREVIDLPLYWSVRLCPIDLHSLAMVLGSPEDLLLQLVNAEVNAYFHGTRWVPAAGSIHTNAKLPGVQACVEKASVMTAGALWGARSFGTAGSLSLDEVFSAEQLLYDLEIRDHVQRLVEGIDGDCDPERCLQDVREGLPQRSFVGLDSTLQGYPRFYWRPRLFERRFLAAWQGAGAPTIRQQAQALARELVSQHEYELDGELRREVDHILARARVDLLT
jgi:trimethylamine:corrinoid methyltransferase-like protein